MTKKAKYNPSRHELIFSFDEWSMRITALGWPRDITEAFVGLCYIKRDLRLRMMGYEPGPPFPWRVGK